MIRGIGQFPPNRILKWLEWGDYTEEELKRKIENGEHIRSVGTIAIALYALMMGIEPKVGDSKPRCPHCGQVWRKK
jgi:hypothetical protein